MKNISLELYRTFWAAGKTGSLTKAAALLYVTQPSVSFALKSLEEQLGAILCIRSQKGVALTAEGQVLFEEIDQALGHIETAERKVHSLLNLESGRISISAGDTVCNYFLMPLISAFTEKYPSVRFEITNRTSPETLELVCTRKAEIGFVNICPDGSVFKKSKCIALTHVLIGGTRFAPLADTTLPLSALAEYPLVMLERKSSGRVMIDHYCESIGVVPAPVFELGSVDLMISFVQNNHGLAFIHEELCGHLIDGKTLFRIQTEPTLPQSELLMIELNNMPISHAASHFKRFIMEQ
jgi:DNA-binding transcriptional LysR family regulator